MGGRAAPGGCEQLGGGAVTLQHCVYFLTDDRAWGSMVDAHALRPLCDTDVMFLVQVYCTGALQKREPVNGERTEKRGGAAAARRGRELCSSAGNGRHASMRSSTPLGKLGHCNHCVVCSGTIRTQFIAALSLRPHSHVTRTRAALHCAGCLLCYWCPRCLLVGIALISS